MPPKLNIGCRCDSSKEHRVSTAIVSSIFISIHWVAAIFPWPAPEGPASPSRFSEKPSNVSELQFTKWKHGICVVSHWSIWPSFDEAWAVEEEDGRRFSDVVPNFPWGKWKSNVRKVNWFWSGKFSIHCFRRYLSHSIILKEVYFCHCWNGKVEIWQANSIL